MTEKRFTMVITGNDGSFHYWDKVNDERITSTLELENKLNELADENEQLREEIKDLNDILARKEEELIKPIIRQIEDAMETERTHIGRNVLKQLLQSLE